jgi:hypothetical protein
MTANKKTQAMIAGAIPGACANTTPTYTIVHAPPKPSPTVNPMTAAIGSTVRTESTNARSSISLNESGRSVGVTAPS